MNKEYISGIYDEGIPQINSIITLNDKWHNLRVRIKINRNNYTVEPGIYALGNPTNNSDVFVTANYKLTFDIIRKELKGYNVWILVLDTKGINVWCAAGKGTFGTNELIYRLKEHQLSKIINHNRIILPQLGAPGIAAHEIKKQTGFIIKYGPIRASDITTYLENNKRITPEMRKVNFTFYDRLILTGVEVVSFFKYILLISIIYFILSCFNSDGINISNMISKGSSSVIIILVSYFTGTIIGPLLLPWLPGRSFALKGFFAGFLFFIALSATNIFSFNYIEQISWFLVISSISSFLVMNFTGTSTYTSLSGVMKEMKYAVPIQALAFIIGFVLWIINLFL